MNGNVTALLRELGLTIKGETGNEIVAYCPFCEEGKTNGDAHLYIEREKGLWDCKHGCGSGNPFTLAQRLTGLEPKFIMSKLAEYGFEEKWKTKGGFKPHKLTVSELARQKQVSEKSLELLGAFEKGSGVAFPMHNAEEDLTGYRLRLLNGKQRTWKPEGGKTGTLSLFIPSNLDKEKPIILCEGETSTAKALDMGLNAAGTPGAGKLKKEDSEYFRGCTVHIVPDLDKPGIKGARKIARMLWGIAKEVKIIRLPGEIKDDHGDDLRDFFNQGRTKEQFCEIVEVTEAFEMVSFEGDTFSPLKLAKAIKKNRKLIFALDPEREAGHLMEYNDGVWRPAIGLESEAKELLGEEVRINRVREALWALKHDVPRKPWTEWNPNRGLVNCLSGMVNPVTKTLLPHDPSYYSTFQIPVAWNPLASCERVKDFLFEVLPEDSIDLVKDMMGYLTVPNLSSKKFFVLEGPGDSGKTTFLDALLGMIGKNNWVDVPLHELAENRFAMAQLENKLIGTYDDLDRKALRSVSKIKALTGSHPWIRAERKGQDAYDAPLYARLLFTCNKMPESPDKSDAWYMRPCLIPFRALKDKGITVDRTLGAKLATKDAKEFLFKWAVDGLHNLIERGWEFPETRSTSEQLRKYELKDKTVVFFVKECCKLGSGLMVVRREWYEKYSAWCEEKGLHIEKTGKAYEQLKSEFGIEWHQRGDGKRVFDGITLKCKL